MTNSIPANAVYKFQCSKCGGHGFGRYGDLMTQGAIPHCGCKDTPTKALTVEQVNSEVVDPS